MAYGLIGKKIGMTQVFTPDGTRHAVTVVEAGPNFLLQVKTKEKDGYNALQLGFGAVPVQWKSKAAEKMGDKKSKGTRKKNSVTKPMFGHFKKAEQGAFRHVKEFRLENVDDFEVGMEIPITEFGRGDMIQVTGTSKGKGFQGVIKRYGFARGRMTHGSRLHREPGAIGACATPARVFKNKRLPGQTGNKKITVKNLTVVSIDEENHLLYIKGAVPGSNNGIVYIQKGPNK